LYILELITPYSLEDNKIAVLSAGGSGLIVWWGKSRVSPKIRVKNLLRPM